MSAYFLCYMENVTATQSLFVLHLLSFPCHSAFTACSARGGVYDFIKPHDASSCFYKCRREKKKNTRGTLPSLHSVSTFPNRPQHTHLTLLNPLNWAAQGLLHATVISNRGFIPDAVKGRGWQ